MLNQPCIREAEDTPREIAMLVNPQGLHLFAPDLGLKPGPHGFVSELVIFRYWDDAEAAEVWYYDDEIGIQHDAASVDHDTANWFEAEAGKDMTLIYDGVNIVSGHMKTHYVKEAK